ncbi:MAG: FKBP-type peptidyl-prolyl cis-trans isomerase, partial [Dysgonamonadaceae bacterium]|nr:FKBP-type peptidyl-prolyl cis-trans isomerase [Dysgonamonadaceae bacterium]
PGERINLDLFIKGLKQALASDSSVLTINQYELQMFMQNYFSEAQQKDAEKAKAASEKFLEENKKKDGVKVTPSGLQYKVIKEGTGEKPDSTSTVKVHYVGTLADGTEFDSSVKRGEPTTFRVDQVIKGWTEGLLLMPVGSKYTLYVPSELGYGDRGAGGKIKGNSALIFEVELLEIVKPEAETSADKSPVKK